MVDSRLDACLSVVGQRLRRIRFAWILSIAWLLIAVLAFIISQLNLPNQDRIVAWAAIFLLAFAGFVVAWIVSRRSFRDRRQLASLVETRFTDLQQRLLTAVQIPVPERGRSRGFLHQSLLDETLKHAWRNRWEQSVPRGTAWLCWIFHYGSLGLACLAIMLMARSFDASNASRQGDIAESKFVGELVIEPGDTEVERGNNLVITARFGQALPTKVFLETKTTASNDRSEMRRNLQDPIFGGYLMEVTDDVEYRVAYGNETSRWYRAKVFEYPALVRSDLEIRPPAYTKQESRTVEDTRRATVVEGTEITWICSVNKPLKSVSLVDADGVELPMEVDPQDPLRYRASKIMFESTKWKLRMVDDVERANKVDEDLQIRVLPNKEPEVKLVRASDAQVSPLQEFEIAAHVEDDFSAQSIGVTYSLGDAPPVELKLGGDSKKADVTHVIDLESLKAEPDQLLTYHFWAEDLDRDGQSRRVTSDLFFAEVRPFDEVFREGQPEPGSQEQQQGQQNSQAGQQAEQLAELQKQIIAATWNVLREKNPGATKADLVRDIQEIRTSQEQALEQLGQAAQQVQDPKASEIVESTSKSMQQAIEALTEAANAEQRMGLRPALDAEQAAYQGLLKLRAREHQVMRSQQRNRQQSQSGAAQSRQQQIDQLELTEEENRYETEQKATPPEESAERETRQVMNRLRELARRQQDLNQQLKDLETALQAAKDEQEKEKLEEQLKRLRDAQQDLLRDSDELLDRMNQAESRDALEQARSEVEQARENIRQAADALNQEQTAPALSAGTRAERQLEETREQLRQNSANQFTESMRNMSNDAKELDEKQRELTKELQGQQQQEIQGEGLRPSQKETDFEKEIAEQNKKLGELLNNMQETVDQAEASEPLLADKLYESFRETKQRGVSQQLDQARQLVQRGLDEPAGQLSQKASESLSELRKDIEQAAEGVLGSQVDSLRRAAQELEKASSDLEQEMQRRDPNAERPSEAADDENNPKNESASGRAQPGQGQSDQRDQNKSNQKQPSGDPESQRGDQARDPNDTQAKDPSGSGSGRRSDQEEPRDAQRNAGSSDAEQESEANAQSSSNEVDPNAEPTERDQEDSDREGMQEGAEQEGAQQEGAQQNRSGSNPQRGGGRQSRLDNLGRGGNDRLERIGEEPRLTLPLTGEDYLQWSDRLRDVEELVDDPELQSRIAQAREAAREIRREYKRHAKEPQWDVVRRLIAEPLMEIRKEVNQEILRQTAEKNAVVPIDRDPVPERYQRSLQDYYERLGGGR